MNLVRIAAALAVLLAVTATPAFAAPDAPAGTAAAATATAGNGGIGIGLIGWGAMGGIARQPEATGKIQVNMIVMAALVEGAAIISLLVICFALVGRIPG